MRSASTQNTKPCEKVLVSQEDAAGNCMPEQTSASQFDAVAEGDLQTIQNSVVAEENFTQGNL